MVRLLSRSRLLLPLMVGMLLMMASSQHGIASEGQEEAVLLLGPAVHAQHDCNGELHSTTCCPGLALPAVMNVSFQPPSSESSGAPSAAPALGYSVYLNVFRPPILA